MKIISALAGAVVAALVVAVPAVLVVVVMLSNEYLPKKLHEKLSQPSHREDEKVEGVMDGVS